MQPSYGQPFAVTITPVEVDLKEPKDKRSLHLIGATSLIFRTQWVKDSLGLEGLAGEIFEALFAKKSIRRRKVIGGVDVLTALPDNTRVRITVTMEAVE